MRTSVHTSDSQVKWISYDDAQSHLLIKMHGQLDDVTAVVESTSFERVPRVAVRLAFERQHRRLSPVVHVIVVRRHLENITVNSDGKYHVVFCEVIFLMADIRLYVKVIFGRSLHYTSKLIFFSFKIWRHVVCRRFHITTDFNCTRKSPHYRKTEPF